MLSIKRQYPSDLEIDKLWDCYMPERRFVVVSDARYCKYRFQSHPLESYDCHSFLYREEAERYLDDKGS